MNEFDGDLNHSVLPLDWGGLPLSDPTATSTARVTAHFRDLDKAIIGYIQRASMVVGCVAWRTHLGILHALSRRDGVSLLVQKEDFLRPDSGGGPSKDRLRQAYGRLHGPPRGAFAPFMTDQGASLAHPAMQSGPCDRTDLDAWHVIDPVRCVGIRNAGQTSAVPRMHHKFIVFCRLGRRPTDDAPPVLAPYAVWTGSFNFTTNGSRSLENAVYIHDEALATAYLQEYTQLALLSEPLDWQRAWVAPEWRIGT